MNDIIEQANAQIRGDAAMRKRLGIKERESVSTAVLRTMCALLDRIERLEGKR